MYDACFDIVIKFLNSEHTYNIFFYLCQADTPIKKNKKSFSKCPFCVHSQVANVRPLV